MKGIILAAGKGTRLYPMTKPVCKPLLPIYDKPLIYYPLSVMLQAGIKEILIIIPPGEEKSFFNLLGDGVRLGITIKYAVQEIPRGIADAFIVAEDFIGGDNVCLILGDNIFYSKDIREILAEAINKRKGAAVFGIWMQNPRPFGVVEFDESGNVLSLEEKPVDPKSNYIIPGIYFYDNQVVSIAKTLQPSARGELEITDINIQYMEKNALTATPLPRDFLWFDAGTADSLLDAANIVKAYQDRGHYIGYPEITAYENKYIDLPHLVSLTDEYANTNYGKHIMSFIHRVLEDYSLKE